MSRPSCPSSRPAVRTCAPDPVALGLAAGWLLDQVLADPRRGHPVAAFGRWAGLVEARCYGDEVRRGGLAWGLAVVPVVALAGVAGRGGPARRTLVTAAATWAALGGTSLAREGAAVHRLLVDGDLPAARVRVRHLVGRRTERASVEDVARATVESLAENTSDAVVATLVWGGLLGPTGVVAHRAVNTLDAMWGHRSPRYVRFGRVAARVDDVLGWLPARVTVLATAGLSGRPGAVLRVVARDAGQHPSPNAGPVEAAAAAALGVRLGGRNEYAGEVEDRGTLGDGPPVAVPDIPRAVTLSRRVGALTLAAVLLSRRLARRPPSP